MKNVVRTSRRLLACLVVLLLAAAAAGQTVTRPIDQAAAADVALLRFTTGGHAEPTGRGLAVVDAAGRGVPYRLLAHHPGGETVIAIDLQNAALPLSLQYSTRPLATAKPSDEVWPSLVMQTFPLERLAFRTPAELAATLTPQAVAGTVQARNIYSAANPFGPPGRFATLFQGLLKIDRPGEYRFFSVNAEAGFVEIGGQIVINQPQRTVASDPAALAQQATAVSLPAGTHPLRYLHAHTGGERPMAIFGLMQGERPVPVPAEMFVHHRWARLGPATFDHPAGIGFDAQRLDEMSYEGFVYTRYRFAPLLTPPQGRRLRWSFGDGTTWLASLEGAAEQAVEAASGDGSTLDHVFVAPEAQLMRQAWTVTLELLDERGRAVTQAATTFRPANLGDARSINDPRALADYAVAVGMADYEAAEPDLMAALFTLLEATEDPARIAPLAEPFVQRFGSRGGEVVWKMKHALATHLSRRDPQRAEKLFGELAASATDTWKATLAAAEQLDLLIFRLGRAEGIETLITRQQQGKSPRERALLRSRLGDLHRVAGRFEQAEQAYREAQQLAARQVDARQAAVLQRGRRETAVVLLEQGRLPAMREELLQWEADFPTAKLGGELPLLTGRYFQAIGDDARAAQEFETLLKLNPLHASRPEIVYRLAQSQQRLGKTDEAEALFQELAREYPHSPFAGQAPAAGQHGGELRGANEPSPLQQVGRFNPLADDPEPPQP